MAVLNSTNQQGTCEQDDKKEEGVLNQERNNCIHASPTSHAARGWQSSFAEYNTMLTRGSRLSLVAYALCSWIHEPFPS